MPRSALARKPLPKPSPESDPRYRRVMEQLKQGAAKTKAHPPASKKAQEAAKAAKGPPNERVAGGKAKQVDKIKEAKEGKPDQNSFLAMLRAEIAKAMPKTLGETENFDSSADAMKGGLKGNVSSQKEKSTQDVSGASKQAPTPAGEAKAEQPLPKEGAPQAPKVDAAEGMPAPKSDADVSLQDSKQDVDAQMKEAEVTPTSLKKANDPRFSAVVDAKNEVAKNADAGPAKYRAAENGALAGAASKAAAATRVGAAAMIGVKGTGNAKVLTRQQQQKAKDEAKRKEVVDKIESIYNATKGRVEAKLAALDPEVNGLFDRGVDAALTAMKNFVNGRIRDYKIRRYLSIPVVGLARWIRDQVLNLPDEVNVFYEQGRALFQAQMDALIVRVANLVEQRLKEAKSEVAKGQAEIKAYVATLSPDLQKVGAQAQADVNNRFQELEKGIEEKKNSLAQSLAQKYKEGFDKANEALKAIQDSNKGFVAAFAEKLGEVIKAIMEFKARLEAILRKGADTIKLIIADPLGFLGNLISAVKGGISAFGANIWTHLKAGFMKWLLGNVPPGITIPSDFTPGSVFKLVLGVLGITYEKMRAKAVKLIGERAVTVIETVFKYVKALIEGGPAKLWEEVKADLSNLKEMVIGAFQDWLVTTIVQKAIVKIVSMFNPAGAIVQAIMAIISIVQFVVEKAAQIMEFVESVINSVHAIATGSIGGAVKRIETALANAVPILIGFLASLLGLSGVSKKIREFILKVQSKVDAAIDKAIAKIVAFVKKLIGKGGGGSKDQLRQAVAAASTALTTARTVERAAPQLRSIRQQFKLTSLKVRVLGPNRHKIVAKINPDETGEAKGPEQVTSNTKQADPVVTSIESKLTEAKAAAQELAAVPPTPPAGPPPTGQLRLDLDTSPTGVRAPRRRPVPNVPRPGRQLALDLPAPAPTAAPQTTEDPELVARRQLAAQNRGEGVHVTTYPSQQRHVDPSSEDRRGIDVLQVVQGPGGERVVEVGEIKLGGRFRTMSPERSSRTGNIDPQSVDELQPGTSRGGSAHAARLQTPGVAEGVVAQTGRPLAVRGAGNKLRLLENKISAITTFLVDNLNAVYALTNAASSDPAVPAAMNKLLKETLADEKATLKFVFHFSSDTRASIEERRAARRLIQAVEQALVKAHGLKAKIKIVGRYLDGALAGKDWDF